MTVAASPSLSRPVFPAAVVGIVAAAAILAAGTVWHALSYANTDIAWLLTVGEHLLDGAVLYRDIIETNPPGSVLLYLPASLIARALGADPQTAVMLLTGFACGASLTLCGAVLRPVIPAAVRGSLLVIAALLLAVLPMGSFGQREHVILLAVLPLLCRLAVRGAGEGRMGVPSGTVAGIAAGIGLAIKPYYALGLVGPALLLWRKAGWRGLEGAWELWLAGATAAVLLGAQLLLFPAFTHEVLPLLTRVYLPMRLPPAELVALPGGAAAILALIGCALARGLTSGRPTSRRPIRQRPVARPVAAVADTAAGAALGFFAAYGLQGKGWPYHAYPAIAAALLAIGIWLVDAKGAAMAFRLRVSWGAAVLLAGWAAAGLDGHLDIDVEAPGLVAAVAALGPHPRILSLASDLAVGHPLARRVEGRWVGTLMASWIDLYADRIAPGGGRAGPLGADLAFEDRTFASDIRTRHPDAVLAWAPGWERWIADAPAVAAALATYRPAGTYGSVTLWTPKPTPGDP